MREVPLEDLITTYKDRVYDEEFEYVENWGALYSCIVNNITADKALLCINNSVGKRSGKNYFEYGTFIGMFEKFWRDKVCYPDNKKRMDSYAVKRELFNYQMLLRWLMDNYPEIANEFTKIITERTNRYARCGRPISTPKGSSDTDLEE